MLQLIDPKFRPKTWSNRAAVGSKLSNCFSHTREIDLDGTMRRFDLPDAFRDEFQRE